METELRKCSLAPTVIIIIPSYARSHSWEGVIGVLGVIVGKGLLGRDWIKEKLLHGKVGRSRGGTGLAACPLASTG